MNTSSLHLSQYSSIKAINYLKIPVFFMGLFLQGFIVLSQGLISQTEVTNFTRKQYEAGTQNWAMAQDAQNRLYIANNEGLLVYDGTNWQRYPVPNKTIVRSLGFGEGGKLYVGAQDELGYFAPDGVGRLKFTSLKGGLPPQDKKFTDVWQLEVLGKEVFFRTNEKIFQLQGKQLKVYPSPSAWLSMYQHQGQLLAQDKQKGLLVYQNGQWKPFIAKNQLPSNFLITALTPYQEGTSLLSTVSHGLYWLKQNQLIPFELKSTGFNTQQHFTSLSVLDNGDFLVGTYFNGIYHITKQGKVLEQISTQNGMYNNTVRCLLSDTQKQVWIGLDNGLAFYTYDNAVKLINPPIFNNGIGYDVKVRNNDLYFALSTGIFRLPSEANTDLSTLTQTPQLLLKGLTWHLSFINNQLLAGRDDGLFAIQAQEVNPITQFTGYWACRPMPQPSSATFLAGNYLGVHFFEMKAESFVDIDSLQNFKESSRYIETDGSSIWVSHPYRGVYKISLSDQSIRLFSQKEGLPTNLENHVFKIKGEIVFATSQGIYSYEASADRIVKSKKYEAIFGEKPIRYLKEDKEGNLWFVQEKMLGVVDFSGNTPKIHYIPELRNKIVSGFENIFPYDSHNILIGGEPGFYHLDYVQYLKNIKPFTAYVAQVKTSGIIDSVLFGGYGQPFRPEKRNLTIPYALNSLLFSYTASVYGQLAELEYSHYLEGFDQDWSNWSSHPEKEYTNLPAGTYTFKVKARKSPSHESSISTFTFTVLPPWYQTWWAYLLYFVCFVLFLFLLLKYQAKRQRIKQAAKQKADLQKFEEEQRRLAYKHQLELAESEKETIRLRNEKLDAEIKHKNAELASATMNLVQKRELILKLKKGLQQLQKNIKTNTHIAELKTLLKALSEEEKLDEEWENFFKHFNSVHGDFLTLLRKKFPTLNPHYLRLCAYLRMNLSSKEIAPLMGISIRGVEINRYRLRKQLDLPTDANLVEYLLSIEDEEN